MKPTLRTRNAIRSLIVLGIIATCGPGPGLTSEAALSSTRVAQNGPLVLTYVANCGVLVSSGDRKVLVDALFDRPNPEYRAPAPEVLDKMINGAAPFDGVDLVLVTHNHPDHFDAALAVHYLEVRSQPVLLAPVDAVAEMRRVAADWPRIAPRIVSLDLKVGKKDSRTVQGIPVVSFRTLHSGDRESPMNLMYLFEPDGWRVWHEGDSNGKTEVFEELGLGRAQVDLALVQFWYPLEPNHARFLLEVLKADRIALMHLPIRMEADTPGKIDQIRQYFKDVFLLLPGMPAKVIPTENPLSPEGFFGQAPPSLEPVKFWPDVLAAERCPHGQLAFSPDGTGVFWSAILPPGPEQTIYFSAFDGMAFSKPAVAPFAAASGNGGPAPLPGPRKRRYAPYYMPALHPLDVRARQKVESAVNVGRFPRLWKGYMMNVEVLF